MVFVREKTKMFHEASRDEKPVALTPPSPGTRFCERGGVERLLRFQAKREVL